MTPDQEVAGDQRQQCAVDREDESRRRGAGNRPAQEHADRRPASKGDQVDAHDPAALENQLTDVNAGRVKARIILEGANGPTTPEAEAILEHRGALIIPDVYANAGGVIVSYFEWLKNLSHVRFGRLEKRYQEAAAGRLVHALEIATGKALVEPDRALAVRGVDELAVVNSGLEETIVVAYQEIQETYRRRPELGNLQTAAFLMAIDKVARAYLELGVFP